jgi:hypothetical protein
MVRADIAICIGRITTAPAINVTNSVKCQQWWWYARHRAKDFSQQRLELGEAGGGRWLFWPWYFCELKTRQPSLFLSLLWRSVRQVAQVVHDRGTDHPHYVRRLRAGCVLIRSGLVVLLGERV